jgi:hypothetical protein
MALRKCRPQRAEFLRRLIHRRFDMVPVAALFEEKLSGEPAVLLHLDRPSRAAARVSAELTGEDLGSVHRPGGQSPHGDVLGRERLHAVGRGLAVELLNRHVPPAWSARSPSTSPTTRC